MVWRIVQTVEAVLPQFASLTGLFQPRLHLRKAFTSDIELVDCDEVP
jgi:hypothetical protein